MLHENKIEVNCMKSEYCAEEHLTIVVDDIPLDKLLHSLYPSRNFLGLVPTIVDWLDDEQERVFVKRRFTSANQEEILPILMCPDDCDLWCTVIVANVVKADGQITWKKIGVDVSTREDMLLGCGVIGSRVDWLDKIVPMNFEETQYWTQLSRIYD